MFQSRWLRRTIAIAITIVCLLGIVVGFSAYTAPAMAASQAYTWKSVMTGAGGGYVPGIIFNETEPNLIYARTDIGGAYRWNESTQSWTQLLNWVNAEDWNDTGVDALATDPVDPDRLYLLVGTYTNNWTSRNGAVLRSTNRGNTFTRTELPFKVGGNMPGRNMGERLVIDPNNNSILFLGARSGNGLWKSTNYGSSWTKVTSFPDPGQYAQDPNDTNGYLSDIMGIAWIAFDKSSGSSGSATPDIYVGVADPNGTNIYRSTNGGSTWSAVPGQVTCTSSGDSVSCTNGSSWTVGSECPQHAGLGLIPHHGVISSDGYLYVTYSDTLGPYDGDIGDVYKLNLANDTWTRISPRPSTAGGDCSSGLMGLLTGYGGLTVDRQNPQTIMVSELNRWWPDVNFWRSTDGGTTWTSAWEEAWPPVYTHMNYPDISAAPWLNFGVTNPGEGEPPVKLGWMVGDFEIDPFNSNRFFYGTGATIYGGTNLTAWDSGGMATVRVMAEGVEETSVLDLVSPPSGSIRLYSAMGDIGGFRHVDLNSPPSAMYTQPVFGSTTDMDYAELSTTFWVRVGNVDKQYNPDTNRAAFSYDSGANWFQANNEPSGVTGGGTVAAAANASRVVWSPAGASVVVSTDNGNSWTTSQGIPSGAVVASDRVNPNKFYGLANGAFYVSTDGGANFAQTASGLPTFGEVKAVPGIEGDIWVVGGAGDAAPWGMWHSTNSGSSFTQIANVQGADSIGFGMAAPGQSYPAVYAAAKVDDLRGAYRSDDGGATWIRITDDQHEFATIQTITGDPTIYGRVYIGTNGLGALYGDPQGPAPTTVPPTSTPVTIVPPTSTPVTIVPPTSTPVTVVPPTSTPTSVPTSVYQAEDATLGGGVSVDTNHTGYYGTGFVNFPSSGGYVEYRNVDGGAGGSRTLRFRHALGASSSRTGQLTVNGANQNITFSPTGSWDTWAIREVTVNLNAGATNTIRLQSTGQDLANQDQMEVVGGMTPTATPVTVVPPTATPVTVVPPTSTPVTIVPPTSTPVTVVPPTSTPVQGACSVNYVIQNDWGSGATVNVTIRNNGTSDINGWTLCWTFPGNQQIANLWNGSYTQSGASICVSDAGWNALIRANGGITGFGFNLSYSGSNEEPTDFTLNGTACEVE